MNRVLMQVIVDLAGFLDLSDEDTVQLDAAVEQLEHLRAELLTLTPENARSSASILQNGLPKNNARRGRRRSWSFCHRLLATSSRKMTIPMSGE